MSVREDVRPPRAVGSASAPEALPTTAWLIALPCMAIAAAVALLLGPPLSHVLYPARLPFTFLPNVVRHPEPLEGTRYVLALLAPVLLAAGIVLAWRRPPRRSPRSTRAAAVIVQALGAALVVACLVKQRERGWELAFFAWWQLLAGAAIAAALAVAARRGWLTRLRPEPRWLRVALPVALALLTGAWFSSFLNSDQSIWWAGDPYNSGFMLDETFAVLNGRTPLVDFTAAYGSVSPFLLAPWMLLFGKTVLAYTFAMWALSVATVLAVYGALLHVTRRAVAAFALSLPIMAFCFFAAVRDVHHPQAIFQEMPLRNVGPFVVAWLLARHLDRGGRSGWPLFLVAGLAAINNVEFGVAALAGTVVALVWTSAPLDARRLLRIAAGAALGLAGAYALLAVVTLIRAGALPDPGRAVAFARIFGTGGFGLDPIPHLIGLPLVVFLTYVGALGAATVRAAQRQPNRVLTGMLAWSAIYGLGSGAYYVGESVPRGVPTLFPPWSFALALLTVVAVRQLARRSERLPSLGAVAVLLGFGLVASFVLDPPAGVLPWRQVATIEHRPANPAIQQYMEVGTLLTAPNDPAFREFVGAEPAGAGRQVVRPGEPIALLWSTGHAIADGYGFRNVVPYVGESIVTVGQLDETLAGLRAAGGRIVLVPLLVAPRLMQPLAQRGFEVLTRSGYRRGIPGATLAPEQVVIAHGLTKWVDGRTLAGGS